MNYQQAVNFLRMQGKNISKIHNTRLTLGGYEYRITYRGGFAAYVAIDRREIGKRNFKYFGGVGAYHCRTVKDVLQECYNEINKKTGANYVLQ